VIKPRSLAKPRLRSHAPSSLYELCFLLLPVEMARRLPALVADRRAAGG